MSGTAMADAMAEPRARISRVHVRSYRIPTTLGGQPRSETDGTARWDHTDVLVVEVHAGDERGLGYSYTSSAAQTVVRDTLAGVVLGADACDTTATLWAMARAVRNMGRHGIAGAAVSAMDVALHDLRARLFGASLIDLFGAARSRVRAYGSGGFTDYTDNELAHQLEGWATAGMTAVKMKIGSDVTAACRRVMVARAAIGNDVELFIDANGALERKPAIALAERVHADAGVTWFEEPVSSDDLVGLHLIRDRSPAPMRIAAGEYADTPASFRDMIRAGAVDTLQADATRCGGVTGFLNAAAQCTAEGLPLSAHTAPALHAVLGCIAQPVVHVESFHDHELIEALLFDGVSPVVDGFLEPRRNLAGHGLFLSGRGDEYCIGRDDVS
ncbi:hypothetical protein LK09_14245 [Microbacterium mangrovi]|uniref:Mandelate racemase/muconate lactonizing enzyme C-terminal domain-containing protein n=1 Tax=Microbacterium mangrovi TaxID=1348253 RepID=A0A0B2A0H9_9MICO|nr:enolase C-terminal domain-like protein [Microbacterium mangrovi]KHK96521.1 hypothetical protein LK09_14245 [Microbacterium mangrovi]